MEFVRQQYAGWLGLKNNNKCTNGVLIFDLTSSNKVQLLHAIPSKSELKQLLVDYDTHNKSDSYGFRRHIVKTMKGE